MKFFDGKKASQDYMSMHTLAFSTPELTLMRFAFWLGEAVPDPEDKDKSIPRMMTYLTEEDFDPVVIDDDTYVPTGAVRASSMYGNPQEDSDSDTKFCFECGSKISTSAKFCTECGATQE